MFAAMTDVVAERGYSGTTMLALRKSAHVSSEAIYREFPTKDAYFAATYEFIARLAIVTVSRAYRAEQDRTAQLRSAFDAFAQLVVHEPKAARLATVEALGAGPTMLEPMERVSRAFESLIESSFIKAPDGVTLPPLVARGIVGGISRVTRQLLLERRENELPALAAILVNWALSYHCADALALPHPPTPTSQQLPPAPSPDGHPDSSRILQSAAWIAATSGYPSLTISRIVQIAKVPDNAFFALYESREQCFMDSYDLMGAEVVATAAEAALEGTDWIDSIQRGVTALMSRVGHDPVFARCAFIEVFAAGCIGIERRSRLMDKFAALLMSRVPSDARPPEIVAEAIVGAVWHVAHQYVARNATQQLPQLAHHAAYLVLAPIIGGEAAMNRILASPHT